MRVQTLTALPLIPPSATIATIMKIILTHENADFDAIAAQLAAHKLNPDAIPVLPHHLHRNVRHFVSLYRDELPYQVMDDLSRGDDVTHVIVVDNHTVQTVRGMHKKTSVQIIDHHTPRNPLNGAWDVTIDPIGATTTIITEQLRERGISLTALEATLLALGIYEDTGALTYGGTTPRDIYAAGWLVEQGAQLDTVNEFLHHPLEPDQLVLYEALLDDAQTYHIEGFPIVIACAEAPELVSEVSTLAHKLRDVLEPAAIFLLVRLETHIQLVARSSVDEVNVGEIAAAFDGGGHPRAAAGIIRKKSLEATRQMLLDVLHKNVHPGLKVVDIMSHGVRTLTPETRADDAAQLMRQYGHEGYPVVVNGAVVGLLTRRAVDRALDHGLVGVSADRIMKAGTVTIAPDDSLAAVQTVMMESGWGQIPVIDNTDEIIGVVTRTDLISHIGPAQALSRHTALTDRLEQALPPILLALIRELGRIADDQNMALFVVGGFVRDLLLDQPTLDIDFVVEGSGIDLTRALVARFGGEMRSHERFGTGKWLLDESAWQTIAHSLDLEDADLSQCPAHIDLVSARTEFYDSPTALPDVEMGSIKLDLHRRDFTINTLAIRLDPARFGELLDFYSGVSDLRSKQIRVLHSISFIDDPTRILRAVRLEQRLGFQIEARTLDLISDGMSLLDRVSGARIRHELEFSFSEPQPENVLRRLDELNVLAHIHPGLICDDWLQVAFKLLRTGIEQAVWPELTADFDLDLPYFLLLTYRMDQDTAEAVCRRLKVRRRTLDDVVTIHQIKDAFVRVGDDALPSAIDAPLRQSNDRVLLALWAAAERDEFREQIAMYARTWRHISPITTGSTLKDRDVPPGPAYGAILGRLRQALLDGEISTPDDEAQMLNELLKDHAADQ